MDPPRFSPQLSRHARVQENRSHNPSLPENSQIPHIPQPQIQQNQPFEQIPQAPSLDQIQAAMAGFGSSKPGRDGHFFPFGDGKAGFTRLVISQFVQQAKLGKKGSFFFFENQTHQ